MLKKILSVMIPPVRILLSTVLVASVTIAGNAGTQLNSSGNYYTYAKPVGTKWKDVVNHDSPVGYKHFLTKHPKDKHAGDARARLEVLLQSEKELQDRLGAYKVDTTSIEEFYSDGWNYEHPWSQKLGIIDSDSTDSGLVFRMGIWPYPLYRKGGELAAQFDKDFLWLKTEYGIIGDRKVFLDGQEVLPRLECALLFRNGLLTGIDWLGSASRE